MTGFSFDNCLRNAALEQNGFTAPKARKTGTTICGVVYDGGVVLGADTRATSGSTVFEKDCMKIHYIAPNIMCCGAGTAADTEMTTMNIASQLELHRLSTGRQSRVNTSLTMLKRMLFKYQGHISAALVLGGVDIHGPHLYTVYPHGSTDSLPYVITRGPVLLPPTFRVIPLLHAWYRLLSRLSSTCRYVTMGSGSLAAMAIFEQGYKDGLTQQEAMELVSDAITAGIFNDLGSGGSVTLCVITKDKTEIHRPYKNDNERLYRRPAGYDFKKGTTVILSEKFTPHLADIAIVSDERPVGMEI
mmetsp:Transcript_22060/g.54577  ORF Transcript_22060/g.54577 Transcript_22060/m.54577 type:complete len:302 (-) Transcript_22060:970-1875(-)